MNTIASSTSVQIDREIGIEEPNGYDRAACYLTKKICHMFPDRIEKMWKHLRSLELTNRRGEALVSLTRTFAQINPFVAMHEVKEIKCPGFRSRAKLQLVKGLCELRANPTLIGHACDLARSITENCFRIEALAWVALNQANFNNACYQVTIKEVEHALIEQTKLTSKIDTYVRIIDLWKTSLPYSAKHLLRFVPPLINQLPDVSISIQIRNLMPGKTNLLKIVAHLDPEYGIEIIDGLRAYQQDGYLEYSKILAQINRSLARKCALMLENAKTREQMLNFIALQSLRNDPDLFTSTLLSMEEYPSIDYFTSLFAIEHWKNDKKKGLQLLEQVYDKRYNKWSEDSMGRFEQNNVPVGFMCLYTPLFAELDKNRAHSMFNEAITAAMKVVKRAEREDSLTRIAVEQAKHFPMEALNTLDNVTLARRKVECLATIIADSVSTNSFSTSDCYQSSKLNS